MDFSFILTQTPVLWIIVSALFSGAALNRVTRRIKRNTDAEKAKNTKRVLVCIWLSCSILFGLLALIVPGPKKILDLRLLSLFIGCTLFFFLFFRFKKAFMLPSVFLISAFIVVTLLFLQAVTAFTGETKIAQIDVLSIRNEKMTLDLTLSGNPQSQIIEMEGNYFAPNVHVIIFNDLLVFFGAKTWYRFVGLSSYDLAKGQTIAVQKNIVEFPFANGISKAIFEFVENNEKYIPIIKTAQTEVIQKKASELKSYSIQIENDGGVEVAEIK